MRTPKTERRFPTKKMDFLHQYREGDIHGSLSSHPAKGKDPCRKDREQDLG